MKRVLITGGAGFLGSHLCDRYLKEGWSVIAVDNFVTGNKKNVAHLENNEHFTLLEHDISKPLDVKEKIDLVMHFASPASPVDYQEIPIQTLKVGSLGTHNCLGLALKHNSAFLLASTSEVYGDPLVNPQPETYWGNVNPVGLRGCYDEAKRFGEAITMAYHRIHKLDTKIVRIFNTYGPRMRLDDGRVVPNFIKQALDNEPLTVYGEGTQTRSFCFVSDLIDGIYKLSQSDEHEPVNIGNPDEYTILEFANIIKGMMDTTSEIEHKPLPADDPQVRRPDISKAQRILKWEPQVPVQEGLKETIAYFQK